MQKSSGRPKDLAKKAKILQAATAIFLKMGYHATSMQHIAQEAGVSKLTVYNHFQDKANLFTCAIETSCETSIFANPVLLTADSLFEASLTLMCQRALNVAYLPEALKLDRLLFELAAEQSPLTAQFFNASHIRMRTIWAEFFSTSGAVKIYTSGRSIPTNCADRIAAVGDATLSSVTWFGGRSKPARNAAADSTDR